MNPDPKMLDTYFTAPFFWAVVGAFVAVSIGVWLGKIIRGERYRAMELDDISPDELVNYRCAVNGHEYGHPVWKGSDRTYECKVCGNRVVSGPGWVDGESA